MVNYSASNFLQIAFITLSILGIALLWAQNRFTAMQYLLGATALLMTFNFVEETKVVNLGYLITPSFSLLMGPLFFAVVAQLISASYQQQRKHWVHLAPAAISLLFNHWPQWVLAAGTLSQIVYFSLSIKALIRYQHILPQNRSDANKLRADWVKRILWVLVGVALVDAVRHNLQPYLPISLLLRWYLVMQLSYFLIVASLVIRAVREPQLFAGLTDGEQALGISVIEGCDKGKCKTNETTQADTLFKELNKQVHSQKLYRLPRLSLRDLAQHTGLGEKDVSWAINQGYGGNFNDYVNAQRLADVVSQLDSAKESDSDKKVRLLDIALEAGFNSKSSFNSLFKRHLGMTPSQYLAENPQ
ncbi:helix-turn-helix domain-containing protein [Microbulbifer sp. ANSA003]|uniref:helix-turn-helix domain-containing protein n=1 Tax=Microbulbifer sp. ANSA003 TaxID=3243360 RepID=UPI004041DFFA